VVTFTHPGEVHVWLLRLDLTRPLQSRLERLMSAEEDARAERFVVPADRARYAAAHGLLRVVLSGYLGIRPEEIVLEAGAYGKPQLSDRSGPRFNLSHAGALGLVAVSAVREVGVDVEEIQELRDVDALAEACFSRAELAAFRSIPRSRRLRAFFAGWTRKEAVLKLLGDGLTRALDSFDVSLTPGAPARLLRWEGGPGPHGRCTLRALHPALGYVGAVAFDGREVSIRHRPWEAVISLLEEALATPPTLECGSLPLVGASDR
jgi:4'-phosphopantetheinyl transferase